MLETRPLRPTQASLAVGTTSTVSVTLATGVGAIGNNFGLIDKKRETLGRIRPEKVVRSRMVHLLGEDGTDVLLDSRGDYSVIVKSLGLED